LQKFVSAFEDFFDARLLVAWRTEIRSCAPQESNLRSGQAQRTVSSRDEAYGRGLIDERQSNGSGVTTMFGILISSSRSRVGVLASALALACAGLTNSAFASSPYDGNWSVVITTRVGACDPTARYRLQISNGAVVNGSDNDIKVSGQVSGDGMVNVSVRSSDAWAVASGRLSGETGNGTWKGHGSSGNCEGTWVAERRRAAALSSPLRPAALSTGHHRL
jgi:hypothetical protein